MKKFDAGLVLVGNRSAATDTACRRYDRVVVIGDTPARPSTQDNLSFVAMPPDDEQAIAVVARDVAARMRARGVAAVAESTVLRAAQLRAALRLDGLGIDAARACTDKTMMKGRLRAAGIAVASFVTADEELDRREIVARLGLPLVLKRTTGSGGREMRIVRDETEVPVRLPAGWMAEGFVDGVEMSVEAFVSDGRPVFVNFTAYTEPRWANVVPADPAGLPVAALTELNRGVIDALGISQGMTHMEVFLTATGLVVGEIAARPPGGRIMELIELAYGFDPWAALFAIETGSCPELPQAAGRVAGMRLVHPGPGVVASVNGLDRVRSQPGLVRLHCTARPGKRIAQRTGAGQSAGYALFAGDRACVLAGLACVRDHLEIVVR